MQVTRETILDMIRARADNAGALEQAQSLPESFDTNDHLGELKKLGISPDDLQTEGLGSLGQASQPDDRADDQAEHQAEEPAGDTGDQADDDADDGPQ
jgi:hypothetical protein